MCVIEQLFPLEEDGFFNSDCEKVSGKSLETPDHCAFELFAPKLIHESRNCSNVHSLPPDSFRGETSLVEHDVE
jgi:hypothetical protein